jgi:phosphocarrier protein
MNSETVRLTVLVTNPQGLHLRPLTAFAQLAQQFQARVSVSKDGRSVDGKSPFEMFSMVSLPGTELTIETTGPDAQDALDSLAALLSQAASEEHTEPAENSGS